MRKTIVTLSALLLTSTALAGANFKIGMDRYTSATSNVTVYGETKEEVKDNAIDLINQVKAGHISKSLFKKLERFTWLQCDWGSSNPKPARYVKRGLVRAPKSFNVSENFDVNGDASYTATLTFEVPCKKRF